MNRLMERYQNEVVKSLMEKFNYSSKMQAPKIEKIVLNIGVGDAVSNSKLLESLDSNYVKGLQLDVK